MKDPIGTLLIDFMIVDYSETFTTDHFDWEKNLSNDLQKVSEAIHQMLLAVPKTMIKESAYFYNSGSDDDKQCHPAQHISVLRDIRNYDGLIRLFNIYQAIALLYRENQVNFKERFVKYDPDADYRVGFRGLSQK